MMKLEMATSLLPSALEMALRDPSLNVLLIDCRSFMDFNSCHVSNAHNVHFPPIVKRRSGGTIPLANIIRCAKTRGLLVGGQYAMVVLYDECSRSLDDLPSDSVMYLVLKSLTDETDLHPLYFVEGGFRTFSALCPHFCSGMSTLADPTTHHLQLPSVTMATTSTAVTTSSGHVMTATCTRDQTAATSREVVPNGVSGARRDSAKMRRILLEQEDGPVQVLPWLYLGSVEHASRPEALEELGVRALLNVSSVEYEDIPDTFCYKTIPVADSSNSDLLTWFPMAIEFIESVRQQNSKVLVHCQAGVSRSATICLAYLMYHKGLGLEQAYDYLKARRSVIAPNLNFMQQLVQFETDLNRQRTPSAGDLTPLAHSNLMPLAGLSPLVQSQQSSQDVSVTLEVPTPKTALTLTLTPSTTSAARAPKPCGYMFSFDSPLTPLAQSPGFANCSPLVSPS